MRPVPQTFSDLTLTELSITKNDESTWETQFQTQRANRVAQNAVSSEGISKAARAVNALSRVPFSFNIDLTQGKRCNQEHSGRCWLFASLNVLRQRVITRFDLETYEFSQNYAMFYDKLEKCNLFMLNIIDTADEPIESRLLAYLLDQPMDDGGQWDMFVNIVHKYGVVPKDAMPETACSKNTNDLDALLTRYLRSCCMELRDAHKAGATRDELLAKRFSMLQNIYNMLVIALGTPPKTFDVLAKNKKGEVAFEGTYTPQAFCQEVLDIDLDQFVSCINAPSPDKPMHTLFEVDRLGNVAEDGYVRHLNLPIDEIKKMVIEQLKDGSPVWFGVDMGQLTNREEALMVKDGYNYDDLFGFTIQASMDKAQELTYYESCMTHAMVIEGVKFDADGKPVLWKVENSWGKAHGPNDGFDIMSDAWFDAYVFQVVVKKQYLPKEDLEVVEKGEPVVLPAWDPMGKLAR